jgi:ABC-type antimicrobial peptide transport system permease subunit
MFIHYIITAYRSIAKYKTQNLISVLGLSVALLCFSICLYCTRYIYSLDECFEQRERIAEFALRTSYGRNISGVPADLLGQVRPHMENDVEAFVSVTYARERDYNVEVGTKQLPYTLQVMEVDTTYHTVFVPEVVSGSWAVASRTPNAIVLSESRARKIYGDVHQAIGKQMTLTQRLFSSPDSTPREGGIVYTIQAVIKDLPVNNSMGYMKTVDAWTMNDSEGMLREGFQRPGMTGMMCYALLKDGMDLNSFNDKLIEKKLTMNMWNEDMEIVSEPMGKILSESTGMILMAGITTTAGFLILLVGMLNFFHFLTGSYMTRIREYSLRSVNGAKSFHLWSMLSVQSMLLIIACGLFTGLFMELLAPYLKLDLFEFSLQVDYPTLLQQTSGYLGGLLLICMFTAWIIVCRVRKITILKGLSGGGGVYGKHRLRNVLLGVQIFICWIFVSLAVTLYLQAEKAAKSVLGSLTVEEKEEIFSIPMDFSFISTQEKRTLVEEIRTLPGVKDILISDIRYTHGFSGNMLYTEKGNPDSYKNIPLNNVTPNFFAFMQIPVRNGKGIEGPADMVVDAALEKHYQMEMMGKTFSLDWNFHNMYTVTGVTEPFIINTHTMDVYGCAFIPSNFENYFAHCYVKCHPGEKAKAKASLETFLQKRLPESIEIKMTTMMDDIKEVQALEFKFRGIVGFMALVVIAISLLGIYAAITLDTEYRRKEMAIRKVNGAGLKDIVFIFARLYIWILMITAALAFPIVYVILNFFKMAYAIFIDTGVLFYGGIFVGVSLIIALTVGFRIYLITKVNPAEIIRKE